jgi:hypothetical protein
MDARNGTKTLESLRCSLCELDDDGERGWRIYLLPGRPELETLCPACAERARGEDER